MQFTSFSLELLLDVEDMVLGVLQGLDELAALGCLSSQGGLHYIGRKVRSWMMVWEAVSYCCM